MPDRYKIKIALPADMDTARRDRPFLFTEIRSETFERTLMMAAKVAAFDSSVLLYGETGTGKEIIARYIHWLSPRKDKPLLTLNCGALPETLLEGELFGHKAGAYTGAIHDRVGLFEQAARGTIFLDEVGDISRTTQLKLLRVLQEREILRIGENIPRKVDIRVVAATNRNLDQAVAEGTFREDLLYRLRVIQIRVPPLRERREDILQLSDFFITRLRKRFKLPKLRLSKKCRERLQDHTWPGNVRELENAIEHAAIVSGGETVDVEHLPDQILNPHSVTYQPNRFIPRPLAEVELDFIKQVLQHTGGNRAKAARILKIGQATLWRKLKESGPDNGHNE